LDFYLFCAAAIDPAFYGTLLYLFPAPMLALSFVVVYRFSRRQDVARLASGISLLLILLFSYTIILLALKLYLIQHSVIPLSPHEIVFNIYEGLNYLPALLFLLYLRSSSENRLCVTPSGVWFKNEEISSSFTSMQRTMLSLLVKRILPFGISLAVLLLLSFSTVPLVGELGALFLALKNSIFMAILFLLVPSTHFDFQRFRKRSANIMFWLIWFYMAVLTAFDPSLLSTQELFLNSTFGELFSMLIDRFFLFFVLVFSVGFYSLGNKILEIEGDSICFNG
jgi:hypothetical protein